MYFNIELVVASVVVFFLKKQSKLINKKINKIGPVTVNGKNHGFIKYHYLE